MHSSLALPAPWRDMASPSGSLPPPHPYPRSNSRLVGCLGSCPLVKLPFSGQGKRERVCLLASSSPLPVHKHSWPCDLQSLSEPVCFPSASSSLGNTRGSTGGSGPWGISQQLGRGSLPCPGLAAWVGPEERSPQRRAVQIGYVKGLQVQVGHYASGFFSVPKHLGQARVSGR